MSPLLYPSVFAKVSFLSYIGIQIKKEVECGGERREKFQRWKFFSTLQIESTARNIQSQLKMKFPAKMQIFPNPSIRKILKKARSPTITVVGLQTMKTWGNLEPNFFYERHLSRQQSHIHNLKESGDKRSYYEIERHKGSNKEYICDFRLFMAILISAEWCDQSETHFNSDRTVRK